MINVSVRKYAGEGDLQALANLINTCETVDCQEEGTSVTELQLELNSPLIDKGRDICLWQDDRGRLVGFAKILIIKTKETSDGWLLYRIHPEARGGELEKEIFTWAEKRMWEVEGARNMPVKLRYWGRAERSDEIALLASFGFTGDRYFYRMKRALSEPIPEPQFPQGFTLHQGAQQDTEAWVQMFNDSFIDHWNPYDVTIEEIKYELTKPTYKPELDLKAVAPDGTSAAFCYCSINPYQNARIGRAEGWITFLGTRRGFRKIGLGRAMLLSGLRRLKAVGMEEALLIVDTENPTGALRLYESVGFCKVLTFISHVKKL
ncbi:MAG: GNAT family N-acetyltransferase [Oscillatoriaceae bacterium SKW80]|nr:GNAT family N-acetyltransferase [Oscillatoriaceae bacterium SKYG93]MCX8122141.1 GNAT family N-acetyltransferase [Oscillatoriaceae bacterium SKW80]MDW8454428.1 GNAT family N-acetyltransferase [Oscillatoriaceae cyanobacterium SKYGB_i_bin93]HIK29292.1 GNAT family N-acetyltransferase [Oscillatoriaceae cyanobacterium M7585_C2015_266]